MTNVHKQFGKLGEIIEFSQKYEILMQLLVIGFRWQLWHIAMAEIHIKGTYSYMVINNCLLIVFLSHFLFFKIPNWFVVLTRTENKNRIETIHKKKDIEEVNTT